MSKDYVPHADIEYNLWMKRFVSAVAAHAADLGLKAQDVAALQQHQADFESAFAEMLEARRQLSAATALKNTTRRESERAMRAMARLISDLPELTTAMRGEMGLTIPDETRGHLHVGDETPGLWLEAFPGAVHVHFGTRPHNERFNSKPKWALGCNIYRKKAGESEWQFLNFETSSPYIDRIVGPASDYTYIVQYRGKRASQVGQSSLEATIAARGALAA